MEYMLRRGDTMEMLSVRFGVPVCMIMRANPGKAMRPGCVLTIPPITFCEKTRQYTVCCDDTLFAIARKYGTTMYDISRMNPEIAREGLREGMVLRLPERMQIYTCKPTDTIGTVCEKFGITEERLRSYNTLEKNLYQGLQLRIPRSKL